MFMQQKYIWFGNALQLQTRLANKNNLNWSNGHALVVPSACVVTDTNEKQLQINNGD